MEYHIAIVGQRVWDNGLYGVKTSAVMNRNKADAGLGIPLTANPTFNRYIFIDGDFAFQKAFNCNGVHLNFGDAAASW